MTMENHELNNKILRNVRNKIVVSNLEREENMKINQRKQVVSVLTATLIVLSGGFLTVNAATDGKLVEDIKQKYEEMIVVKLDNDNYQITKETDHEGNEMVVYTLQPKGEEEFRYEINKETLDEYQIQTVIEEGEEGPEIKLYDYGEK